MDGKVDVQGEKVDIQNKKVDIQDEEVDIRDGKVDVQGEKVDIQDGKVDVQSQKVDIQDRKADTQAEIIDIKYNEADIRSIFVQKGVKITNKTVGHITVLYQKFGCSGIFGRSEVASLLGLQNSSASKLIAKLLEAGMIEYVSGHGKGKYRFI